jgi:hypothetical protein
MSDKTKNSGTSDMLAVLFLFVLMVVLAVLSRLDPEPSDRRWPVSYPRQDLEPHRLVYAGPEAVTIPSPGLDAATEARAVAALAGAAYHAGYAEGPDGRTGLWTGAHTTDLARTYALAACGSGCSVLAERRPLHAAGLSDLPVLVLLPEMAHRIGEEGPIYDEDALAVGGAGAWGTGHVFGRTKGLRNAIVRAVAECEARRRAEATPEGLESPPCRPLSLWDAEIDDIRPRVPLYPAAYEVVLSRLVAFPEGHLRLVDGDGVPLPGALRNRRPTELYGARASNERRSPRVIRKAGWPEAGADLALRLCEAFAVSARDMG